MTLTDALKLGPIGGSDPKSGLGPFGNLGTKEAGAGIKGVTDLISTIIGALTVVAAVWFMFMMLFAGYEWISAGGDSKKIVSARERITHAFVGLVIVVGAWSLLAVVGQFFGFNTLNPAEVINKFPTLGQ